MTVQVAETGANVVAGVAGGKNQIIQNLISLPSVTTAKLAMDLEFSFEAFVRQDLKINLNKPDSIEICQYYLKNQCRLGTKCAYKHPSKTKLVVCKHWLRGLCKKAELCEFLHEYNLKKMPECWFYTKLGECTNPECQYLHIDPNSKIKDCAWYARGFCKHGSDCRHKHTRAAVCPSYLTGFCPKGSNCSFGHPKFELPTSNALFDSIALDTEQAQRQAEYQQQAQRTMAPHGGSSHLGKPNYGEITCYKCQEKGHYANVCPNQAVKRFKTD